MREKIPLLSDELLVAEIQQTRYYRKKNRLPKAKTELAKNATADINLWMKEYGVAAELIENLLIEELYNRYYYPFVKLVLPHIKYNRALAEEAVQEGWIQILESIDRFDESRRFFPWGATIMVRRAQRIYYKKQSHHEENTQSLLINYEEERSGPEKEVLERNRLEALYDAMSKLSPTDYQIVYLRFFEKKKMEEIPEILGISRSTVFLRMKKTLRLLQKQLEKQGWGSQDYPDIDDPQD